MRILYVTHDFLAPDLALRLKDEGHEVLLAAKNKNIDALKGTIRRVPYGKRLEVAKISDLIIYDEREGDEPSNLRKQGLSVIGGDKKTVKLELDRIVSNKAVESVGILVPKVFPVKDLEDAKSFILEKKGKWVLKQMGKLDGIKGLNSVAKMDDSEDVVAYIDFLLGIWPKEIKQDFVLQEKIEGHEFACGSYWNGKEFMRDADGDEICEENWEHKPLFPGNLGESTGEQFTVMHYVKAKDSKLFMETLDKCRPILEKIDYRGDFDINCIVNEKGVYFLEFTPRMGVPATSAQIAIHKNHWGDFLKAIADGEQIPFEYNEGYCIVSWLYTKPFPAIHIDGNNDNKKAGNDDESIFIKMSQLLGNSYGMPVLFKEKLSKDDLKNIHLDGVYIDNGNLFVANQDGYVLTVTGISETVDESADKVEELLRKIIVPKGFWRNDFKESNYHKSKDDLIKWGYLNESPSKESKDNEERSLIRDEIKKLFKSN